MKLKALKNYLYSFGRKDEFRTPPIEVLEGLIPFEISMGLCSIIIKNLNKAYPAAEFLNSSLRYLNKGYGYNSWGFDGFHNSFNQSFSSAVSSDQEAAEALEAAVEAVVPSDSN